MPDFTDVAQGKTNNLYLK